LWMSPVAMDLYRTSFPTGAVMPVRVCWLCMPRSWRVFLRPKGPSRCLCLWRSLAKRNQPPIAGRLLRQDAAGMMTVELGADVVVRIAGDVPIDRAAALVRALRGAA
jgi:hypothetical protein